MTEQLCTFFLNGIFFGIDVQYVQEVIRPQATTPVPLAPPDICGLINLRGQILTVIDLQQRLEIGKSAIRTTTPQDEAQGFNIVVSTNDEVVSLLVDDVGDVLEFTQNIFQPPPATLKGRMHQMLAGAYPYAGGLLLVLDTKKILAVN
ncbi:purine-binding chemotaxis protein CheW [Tolypothrix sp. PCC 7910]|uniref:chemotaxis protein CheW n=1 Tax=Tolypothrix sp. PCC 7910 TaxID=2099387 RepID=UPI0014278B6C|nr:chemotaxis protein CheW [Tolypothrix sp. PCC 7910]QIR39939.1 purine-binding chemotaxis protein CheW [Tolypothrix sp. PCC 7910]